MPDSDLLSRELTDEPQALSADELARITGDLDVIEAMASAIATPEHGQVGFINMRRLLATIAADKARIAELEAALAELLRNGQFFIGAVESWEGDGSDRGFTFDKWETKARELLEASNG